MGRVRPCMWGIACLILIFVAVGFAIFLIGQSSSYISDRSTKDKSSMKMAEIFKKLPNISDISKFENDPSERVWKGPFTFIQGADPQFGLIDGYILKKPVPNWDKEIILSREAIRRINAIRPKPLFYIICGDMLHAYPYPDEKDLREKQLQDFLEVYSELDPEIKLVCVCGNHDIGNTPTKETVQIYRDQFGKDYFTFWVRGVKFVVLNSQYFKVPDAVVEETEAQMNYLETIPDEKAKHIVIFQHIPFFINDPEEEDTYFSIDKELRLSILEKLYQSDVKYIFCGHYHRNAGGKYKDMEQIVTSAVGGPLGKDPSGYRIVQITENNITHEYIPFVESTDVENIKFI